MTIDWITVSAQIVNFLILVWLLKRFLYKPVLDAMARREQRIASGLQEAEERTKVAVRQSAEFSAKAEQLETERASLLARALAEAEQEKLELLDQARREVVENRTAWQQQLQEEKDAFLDQLRHESADSILRLVRKALSELAGSELEAQIIATFITRLGAAEQSLLQGLAVADQPIHIVTSFELNERDRARIIQAVRGFVTAESDISFSVSDALLCGIELNVAGRRVSWNIASYSNELGERIATALNAQGAGAR